MIEREKAFKHYLTTEKPRKLTEGTANSYIDYLNNVTKHIQLDITSKSVSSDDAITGIISHLLNTPMPDGSRRNSQSALRAYLGFLQKLGTYTSEVYPDEVLEYIEGAVLQVNINKYERDLNARKECLHHHKAICKVCAIDFSKVYGKIGINFIHIHHLIPISSLKRRYKINATNDLIPVCPNCHAMLHKKNPPYTVKELKEIMNSASLMTQPPALEN